MRTKAWIVTVGALVAACCPASAQARKDTKKEFPLRFHGFLLGAGALRTAGWGPPERAVGDFLLGEGRLRLDITGSAKGGQAFLQFKGDLFYDAVENGFGSEIREGYAGYAAGPLDVRVGRQILTWGVGDLFFINDVFPKDWESFFSGRPMEYLKLGVDGVRLQYSPSATHVEILAIPFFTPDSLPSPERFLVSPPVPGSLQQRENEPPARAANTEIAVRISRLLAGFDVSLHAYRGFWRSPSVHFDDSRAPVSVSRFYPRLQVYGAGAQRPLSGGVLSLEAGYYDSRQDTRGENPEIPNSQWRGLAGYQYQPWKDSTVGVQAYGEFLDHYRAYRDASAAGVPLQDRFWGVVSARFTQFFRYQSWRFSVFVAYSPTANDHFLQPQLLRRFTDRLSMAVGANIFGGTSPTAFFGQLRKSDNAYASVRYDF